MEKIKKHHLAKKHLETLRKIEREKHHPLIHKIHKKHNISKKTLFYIKEYGEHSHVAKTIIKESIKILILASILSSFGGFALEKIKTIFISITPFIILLPSLNGMIGNFGTIISSKFSTMLYEGKVKTKWWKSWEITQLFSQLLLLALISAIASSFLALGITWFKEGISIILAAKVFLIVILDIILITTIIFFIAIYAGFHYFRKKEDPNNFLIPITTSIADFSNMIILTTLIILFF
mgnify:CR=1 FL=1